jgi:hypothetical protein
MLARRFAIVCLLTFIFGMSLALLVAEASRSKAPPRYGSVHNCTLIGCRVR